MTNSQLISKAHDFAHRAHDSIEQRRKYDGSPYHVHTDAVAGIVQGVLLPAVLMGKLDEEKWAYMVAAAHLHDYREDVVPALIKQQRNVELSQFEQEYAEFPWQVRSLVEELTDVYVPEAYPKWNRAKRKAAEAERISKLSKEAKFIKMADFFDNTQSIVDNDPDFAKVYLAEKAIILPHLQGVNDSLWGIVDAQLKNGLQKIQTAELQKALDTKQPA